jgi:hypothetical protein
MSIGGMPPPNLLSRKSSFLVAERPSNTSESELLSNLEKSRIEYENLINEKEKEVREKQE